MKMQFAFAVTIFACACAPISHDVLVQSSIDVTELATYKAKGPNRIEGQAFLRQQGGGVVTCAGSQVFLAPDAPYFREIARIASSGGKPNFDHSKDGPQSLVRNAVCDAQGNFLFSNLPDGKYLVMTEVRWKVGNTMQGGPVWRPGEIGGGEAKKVILSDVDLRRH
jgi:hypothetical protein